MHGEGFRKLGFPVCALCCKTRRMSDSNVVIRKKRGRPRTGQDPVLSFRWGLDFKEAIDRWRAGEPHKPSRSEAIRWLIGQGLHVELKTGRQRSESRQYRSRASGPVRTPSHKTRKK